MENSALSNFLEFKYSLIQDIRWAFRTLRNRKILLARRLVVFRPSIFKMFSLWLNRPEPIEIKTSGEITCYWISSGTWGAYTPPNSIFVCPWKEMGGRYSSEELRKVIMHEIYHLYFYDKTKNMDFYDREEFIKKRLKENSL
jgi:hypothetical protein